MYRFAPVLALLVAGCAPQSAELIEGQMVGFLSATTSFTLIKGVFDPEDADESWNIDCRDLEEDGDLLRLDDRLDICDDGAWPPEREVWLGLGAYRGFQQTLDPWRGEAIILNEGDLQIGFHNRLPGGEDFRFIFTIDPNFQPTECVPENGTAVAQNIDGNWVENWSTEIDALLERDPEQLSDFMLAAAEGAQGGQLYFLNAFSFQWNPSPGGGDEDGNQQRDRWTLPEQWRSGFSLGTFSEEDMTGRNNRFGDNSLYILDQAGIGGIIPHESLYFGRDDCTGEGFDCVLYEDQRVLARQHRNQTRNEFELVVPQGVAETWSMEPIWHDNGWREFDDNDAGLDNWSELAYSWVMIKPGSNMEKGGNVSGYFHLMLEGNDSQSRIFVEGEFDVPRIRGENWGARDLRNEKLEEAGTELCQGL
jgi:hypothetical protein